MSEYLVIGIAGGSGSGKTTLMNNLISFFGEDVTVISHDNYYKRHDELTYQQRCGLNYDEPAAFDTDLLDGGAGTARETFRRLEAQGLLDEEGDGKVCFRFSGSSRLPYELADSLLQADIPAHL